jgi:hypothetical protein
MQNVRMVEQTAVYSDVPGMHYDEAPCRDCPHWHSAHRFLYRIIKGLRGHDRFRCNMPGCLCGMPYVKAHEKYRLGNPVDRAKADDEAEAINRGLHV